MVLDEAEVEDVAQHLEGGEGHARDNGPEEDGLRPNCVPQLVRVAHGLKGFWSHYLLNDVLQIGPTCKIC